MPAASATSVLHQVAIELGDRSYPISIGTRLAGRPGDLGRRAGVAPRR